MSFLKVPNELRRLFLQLKGFQSNTYLNVAEKLIGVPNFRLPEIKFSESDIYKLDMPERLRLGNRLERFFSFIIEESDRYTILAENIQIIDNKVTLGEFDFLLFDSEREEVLHVELAGKLYLYDPTFKDELSCWIGPNRKDSLLQKIAKLADKQLPLLYSKACQNILNDFNLKSINIKQRVSYKTRLFMPFISKDIIPENVSAENIKGYYVSLNDFLTAKFENFNFFIPEKQDWIVKPEYGEIWFSHSEIITQLELILFQNMSPLIWVKKPNNIYETIFVVWW